MDDRTNRRKHDENNRRRRSPVSPRRRDRSYERDDGRRLDRDDGRRSDRRHRHRDLDYERQDGRHRSARDTNDSHSHRDSRDRASRRYERDRSRDRSENRSTRQGTNDGREDSSRDNLSKGSPVQYNQGRDGSSKRKASDDIQEAASNSARSAVRTSRFEKNNGMSHGELLSSRRTDQTIETPKSSGTISAGSSQPPIPANEAKIATAISEEDKIRLRQEKLALWKKKKADEQAKKESVSSIAKPDTTSLSSIASSVSQSTKPKINGFAPAVSAQGFSGKPVRSPLCIPCLTTVVSAIAESSRPTMGIGKFGMSTKPNSHNSTVLRNSLNLDGDGESSRVSLAENATPARAIPSLEVKESKNIRPESSIVETQSEDEIDPLDAFMAENSTALATTGTSGRSAGDVLNDLDSDLDAEEVGEEDILAVAAKRAALKKKDLAGVDHSKQDYEEFRKDFYVEPEEYADLTEEEVDAMRLELDGIVIRGKDCPKPVSNWGQCGLSAATLEQIQRLGYDAPTSIQAQAIPAIMSGRDTIGVAKTGSGKTVAFLLPMFRHIKDQRPLESMEGPIAIILTPTRELAVQIHKECKPFLKALDLRAVCVYGGPPIKDQIAEFKRGAEIVVCTPGRMIDILAANQGRVTNLRRITYTVLDEADRMFDLGFEPQVMKIINNIRPQRQTILFSATFPKSMEALARKILRGKPVEITVGARSVVAPEITQVVEVRPADPDSTKFNRVLEILGDLYNSDEDARTLIFVDRQEAADSLLSQLMRKGYPCNALHGGKDQYDRDSTISDFKAGIFPIMVATSVAARGLDVKQLKLVINYDCPNHMEDYVHRVGRTGRAGNKGTAITFVSADQERYAFDIAKALRLSQVEIPEDLKKLADSFAAKVKSGQEKGSASGFGGKGLAKFDTARDKEKKIQRRIYGEDDEPEEEESTSKKPEEHSDSDDDRVNPEEVKAVAEMGTSASADAPIKVERVTAQSRQTPTSKPNVGTKALDPVAAARARIDAINNRIKTGSKPIEQVASNPDAGEYRAMMEINDYPQKARWNVTNRTNIAKVLEATGTSITTQGQYVKPGSTAPAGVPKLYLLVEGPTEICVTDAVKELRRLLSEGTLADADASSTRYKVV